jgi:hypothetical protein
LFAALPKNIHYKEWKRGPLKKGMKIYHFAKRKGADTAAPFGMKSPT